MEKLKFLTLNQKFQIVRGMAEAGKKIGFSVFDGSLPGEEFEWLIKGRYSLACDGHAGLFFSYSGLPLPPHNEKDPGWESSRRRIPIPLSLIDNTLDGDCKNGS